MMKHVQQKQLRYRRAIALFLLGYLIISVLGAGVAVLLGSLIGTPPSIAVPNLSYMLYENCLVLLNLMGWIPLSVWYFKGRNDRPGRWKESLALGLFWAAMAILLDFLLFAFMKNPLYIGIHDFYIVQFPWIYLIYLIVFISPFCSTTLRKTIPKESAVSHNEEIGF
jgi:hypothetical protein